MRKQQSEILLQSAAYGILQRKRDNPWNKFGRHAARECAHSTRSGNGLAGIARTWRGLSLRKRHCCSTNQDSGEQESAAARVNSQGSLLNLAPLQWRCERQYPSLVGYF